MIKFELDLRDPRDVVSSNPTGVGQNRAHCYCGRFAKAGQSLGMNMQGEYEFTVYCKAHGRVVMS